MGGDPRFSLETNKRGAGRLSWEVDYEQYVGAPLPLVPQRGLCPLVIDAVPGAGDEVTIQVARVTLDHQERVVGVACSPLECRTVGNGTHYTVINVRHIMHMCIPSTTHMWLLASHR